MSAQFPRSHGSGDDYLEVVAALMEEFAQTEELGPTLRRALLRIVEVLHADFAVALQLQGRLGTPEARLVCRASVGGDDWVGRALPADQGTAARAIQSNAIQRSEDASREPEMIAAPGLEGGFQAMVCAPMSIRGQRLGAICVFNKAGTSFGAREIEVLSALASAAALAIINSRMAADLMQQARLKQEVEMAAEVQRTLLPRDQARDAPVHGVSLPAQGVSGDYYDILPLPDGRVAFALADVSGKGMRAALIMAKVATLFRSVGRRVLRPGALLARIEAELCETLSFGMFVTMVVGILDPRSGSICLSNAGHLPPILRHKHGRFERFPARDTPLGILCKLENNRYHEQTLQLRGGSLYLYSDGATEGPDEHGKPRGIDGLETLLEEYHGEPRSTRLHQVAERLSGTQAPLHDDLTLLVVEDGAMRLGAGGRRRRRPGLLVNQIIAAEASQLKVVRRLVDAAARQCGANVVWARELATAVDEACQNIIRHGYNLRMDERIQILVRQRGDALDVELVDSAPKVNEEACHGRPLDELRPGGLGTHLIRAFTDRVRYRPAPGGQGNRLVLTKLLHPSSDSEHS